jgi:hypothetical protein
MKLDNGIWAGLCAAVLVAVTALPAGAARIVVDAQFVDRLPAPSPQRLAPILDATVRVDGRFIGFTIPQGFGVIELPVGVPGTSMFGPGSPLDDTVRFPQAASYAGQPIDEIMELIVIYRPGITLAALPPVIAGLPVKSRYATGRYVVLDATPHLIDSARLINLLSDPRVEFVEPNYHYRPAAASPPNDPDWVSDNPNLWGLRLIRPQIAWQSVHESPVKVAVVDSGADLDHPDLKDNLWRNAMEMAARQTRTTTHRRTAVTTT